MSRDSHDRPWTLNITLRRIPLCPQCAGPLTPQNCIIRSNWAFCQHCAFMGDQFVSEPIAALAHQVMTRHSSTAYGIMFYTPRDLAGPLKPAAECLQQTLKSFRPGTPAARQ